MPQRAGSVGSRVTVNRLKTDTHTGPETRTDTEHRRSGLTLDAGMRHALAELGALLADPIRSRPLVALGVLQ